MNGKGRLFLIVGNSASGKDSLLREVLRQWPASARPIRVPRRYITRPAHDSEPFIPVTPEAFEDLKQRNQFFLTWHAYGADYGLPDTVRDWLAQGHAVIANVSREVIPAVRKKIPDARVIFVTVPFPIAQQRLKSRNREPEGDPVFQQRLMRAKENQTPPGVDFVVDNSAPLEVAAEKLRTYLLSFK